MIKKVCFKFEYFFVLIFVFCYSDHVTVNFARTGVPGGQNVNKGQANSLRFTIEQSSTPFLSIVMLFYMFCFSSTSVFFFYFLAITVNTKVDMRFNVKSAYWLSERVTEKILQLVSYLDSLSCTIY